MSACGRSAWVMRGTRTRVARAARAVLSALAVGLAAAAPATAQSLTTDDLRARAERAETGGLRVATTVLGEAESAAYFGVPLASHGVQPVWLEVDNGSGEQLVLNLLAIDPDYFSPSEASARARRFRDEPGQAARRLRFYQEQFPLVVDAGQTRSGFIYANLDPGRKAYAVELVGEQTAHTFEFLVRVPGFQADFEQVDFETLYRPDEVAEVDLAGLRTYLEALPCCVLGGDRETPGDPLNLVVVGDGPHMLATFVRRGWDMTETVRTGSALRTAASSLFGSRYRTSPISGLFVFDRPQDLGLQKARETVDERNHLRLWLAPVQLEGEPVWIGQISRDVGVKLSSKTLITHRIDPVVDEARTYALLDLLNSSYVARVAYSAGVGVSTMSEPRLNYTEDPYVTDGLRVVVFLGESRRDYQQVQLLDWESPPASSRGFLAPEDP